MMTERQRKRKKQLHEAVSTLHESSHFKEKQIKSHQGCDKEFPIVNCRFCFDFLIINHAYMINLWGRATIACHLVKTNWKSGQGMRSTH